MSKSPLRYPGGKSKYVQKIYRYMNVTELEYREPFLGGGSVFIGGYDFPNAWINDIDTEVYGFWRMVQKEPCTLVDLIIKHTPILDHKGESGSIQKSLELWKSIKNDTSHKIVPAGYRCLFLSRTCFSGVRTGGPVGGISQTGRYNLMSRWSKDNTIGKIMKCHNELSEAKITNYSWERLVDGPGKNVVLYLDPPYLKKGKQCYKWHLSESDHEKLADKVTKCSHRYIVSLDDCQEIRKIWGKCGVPEECMHSEKWIYTMSDKRKRNRIGNELFIMDRQSLSIFKQGCVYENERKRSYTG